MLLKAIQMDRLSRDTRTPITLPMLKAFPLSLQSAASSDYEALRFSTAFLLCSLTFLRVGGIAKKGSAVSKVSQVSGACFKDLNVHVTLRYSNKKKQKKNGSARQN